jgi:hypothetical protein
LKKTEIFREINKSNLSVIRIEPTIKDFGDEIETEILEVAQMKPKKENC